MSLPRIVVGVDNAPASRAALEWAAAEAQVMHAELQIVHCLTTLVQRLLSESEPPRSPVDTVQNAADHIRRLYPGLPVESSVGTLRPAAALVEASRTAALVVVGSHSRHRLESALLGSTSREVMTRAFCPTIVVPLTPTQAPAEFPRHVVVGVDGSTESNAALQFGFAEAARHDLPLAAVHVESENSAESYFDRELLQTFIELAQPGREMLAREVEPFALRYPHVHVKEVLIPDRPTAGLLRASAGAHVLVIGSRAHRPLSGSLLGSTALAVVRRAQCPVAVLHDFADRTSLSPATS